MKTILHLHQKGQLVSAVKEIFAVHGDNHTAPYHVGKTQSSWH